VVESSRWDAGGLRGFAAEVLVQVDMPPEDAQVCGDAMVWAAARGIVDHGIGKRLPQLVKRIQAGAVNPRPRWSTLADRPALVLIDADGAWGQVAGTRAMRLAIARAGEAGSAAVVTRNADVTSAMGWYVNLAIEAGMIGLAINTRCR
jgi:L-2-hydroxycarboxylate dehydrogenase (NAD+)